MIDLVSAAAIPAEDEALRAPVRAFVREALRDRPPETLARSWIAFDAEFSRALARRGWVGITLPREYGGGGRSAFARFVIAEELLCAGAPVCAHWVAERQSGPLLLAYGTEEQRRRYLPAICRGEAFFCIGMSEPGAGSDLAAVQTRATRTARGWRLDGQKVWTTNAHRGHYMIALVRTSGTAADRQRGLSQLIVDLSTPGVTVRPITDLAGEQHFTEVFLDGAELPADALIGAEGAGWEQVTAELAYERSGPERLYSSVVLLELWLSWLRTRPERARSAVATVGKIASHLAALRALSLAVTGRLAAGERPATEAALVKDLGTELEQLIPTVIADALAATPDVAIPPSLLRAASYTLQMAPSYSLRGGTREILRGLIARGLGLR